MEQNRLGGSRRSVMAESVSKTSSVEYCRQDVGSVPIRYRGSFTFGRDQRK